MPAILSALTPIAAAPTTRQALGLGNAALASAAALQCGRLTLTSGVPVATSDVTGASTLYFTPFQGDTVSIFDGTVWVPYGFAELSRSLSSLTSGKNYDVFAYLVSGAVVIDLAPAWTNDSTRSTAVSLLNGIYVNTAGFTSVIGSHSVSAQRATLLGTIRSTGTTTTEDSRLNRYVGNSRNLAARELFWYPGVESHNYATATWRAFNNLSGARVAWISSVPGSGFSLTAQAFIGLATISDDARIGIGLSSTDQPTMQGGASRIFPTGCVASLSGYMTSGLNERWMNQIVYGGTGYFSYPSLAGSVQT